MMFQTDRPISEHENNVLTSLSEAVIYDVHQICGVVADERDLQTLKKRTNPKSEGFSFLSKELPSIAKALEEGLETQRFTCPTNFKRYTKNGRTEALPAFLLALLKRVFDSEGNLLSEADPKAIWGIRQICYLLYKYQAPYRPETLRQAMEAVIQVDWSLPELSDDYIRGKGLSRLLLHARSLLLDLFAELNLRDIVPRHSAGACNSPLVRVQSDKYEFQRALPRDCEAYYPSHIYFSPSPLHRLYELARKSLAKGAQMALPTRSGSSTEVCRGYVKILAVPKDSRGPRIIGKEEPELQYLQQGQRRALQQHAEQHWLTRGHVNFKKQGVNGDLALKASRDRYFATLDMKEASDRVSYSLCKTILPDHIFEALAATRSSYAIVPIDAWDGKTKTWVEQERTIKLNKMAPMGSGVCFVLESIVFWALSVAALQVLGWSRGAALENVYVYGDDTIVPGSCALDLMKLIEPTGLKYNLKKSFIRGHFRESCGVDAYKGELVTPLRVKKRLPQKITDANSIVAWVAYGNQFREHKMFRTASLIRQLVEAIPKLGSLPYSHSHAAFLCWHIPNTARTESHTLRKEQEPKRVLRRWSGCDGYTQLQLFATLKAEKPVIVADPGLPWYQGFKLDAWVPVSKRYRGSKAMGLSEFGRYLRYVTDRTEDSDIFGERDSLELVKKAVIVT